MSKPYYVKFETPKDLVNAVYEAVRYSKAEWEGKKGTNETNGTWLQSGLLVIAEDV